MVSPLRRDGSARPRAADHNGAALDEARRRKERTYPELSGDGGRARLVVLVAEVGGRWSTETANFLVSLAKAKALASPFVLQGRVQQAYIRRWSALLACSAVRAFTASLLDRRPVPGLGDIPSVHEVVREARFFLLRPSFCGLFQQTDFIPVSFSKKTSFPDKVHQPHI